MNFLHDFFPISVSADEDIAGFTIQIEYLWEKWLKNQKTPEEKKAALQHLRAERYRLTTGVRK